MPRLSLPIDRLLPDILASLKECSTLVLQSSPGSGKTTRVPPALLAVTPGSDEILVLEPRRLAAKMAARRVAEELGESVGGTVGYLFRFENVGGRSTRLRFLTEGMLMRRLLRDPGLKGVAAVILDEFHERHLHGDIALAYLRDLQRRARPDIRIVVMSATIDCGPIAEFLGGCPVIQAELPRFEIKLDYLSSPAPAGLALDRLVQGGVKRALASDGPGSEGDILVFLPGMADIRRAESRLAEEFGRELVIAPLHGELSREEQDRAITRAPGGRRKVILATNVAETSLTIEGVTMVIDSGLSRQASYSWWTGVPALRTRPISRASAIQRAGRAGRTGPGRCYRLYSRGEFDARPAFDVPEIGRADLAQTFLELKELGVGDLGAFPWFEAPAPASIRATAELLHLLGALERPEPSGRLTSLGAKMAQIPAHPRIARALLEAEKLGAVPQTATLCALVYEGALEGVDALAQVEQGRFGESVARTRTQLLSALSSARQPESKAGAPAGALERAILAGFPDRVAQKQEKRGDRELVLATGGTAWVPADATVVASAEMFIVLDAQEKQAANQLRARLEARSVIAIQSDWLLDLEPSLLEDRDELVWDEARKRVQRSSRLAYGQIGLSESRQDPGLESSEEREAAAKVLLKAALGLMPEALERTDPQRLAQLMGERKLAESDAIETAIARVRLVLVPDAPREGPYVAPDPLAPGRLGAVLSEVLIGKLSLAEVSETDWPLALIAALAPEHSHQLDRLAPLTIKLPSGRNARVNYRLGQNPWVESRLQDFFGMRVGPSILNGRVPLAIHLLAPNSRAVQITTDLAGFWQRHYPQIRRELSRRYPRHKWPEDPMSKPPASGPGNREGK